MGTSLQIRGAIPIGNIILFGYLLCVTVAMIIFQSLLFSTKITLLIRGDSNENTQHTFC